MSDAFSERMRLIRLRRKIEKPRFRDEIKLIPGWLVWTLAFLYVVAVALAIVVNLKQDGGQSVWPWQLRDNHVLASFAVAGVVTACAIMLSLWMMALGYVYRDAKRPSLPLASFSISRFASRFPIPARAAPPWSAHASTFVPIANATYIPAAQVANAKSRKPTNSAPTAPKISQGNMEQARLFRGRRGQFCWQVTWSGINTRFKNVRRRGLPRFLRRGRVRQSRA